MARLGNTHQSNRAKEGENGGGGGEEEEKHVYFCVNQPFVVLR